MTPLLKSSTFAGALALAGFALATGGSAHATTVSGTCSSISLQPTELTNAPISCGTFDSTLGTLSSIALTVNGEIIGTITLTLGNSSGPATLDGTTTSQFLLSSLPGFTFSSPAFTASITTGLQTLSANTSFTSGSLDSGSQSDTITNSALFTPYESSGPGSFSFGISTLTGILISGGGGFAGGTQTTDAEASASVVYTYNATVTPPSTPEPITISLFGAGLAALGLARRRRR